MPLNVGWEGFAPLQGALVALIEFDARPLMERWCDLIVEGNRQGVLSGKDGNDASAPALKYRNGFGVRTGKRRVPDFGTTTFEATGYGPFATGLNDNLSSSAYRQLTGPRLAPRREQSRVIKNLMTEVRYDPATRTWEAVGAWFGVVDEKGRPFLPFHFDGTGRNPRYDLRPIRAATRKMAVNELKAFMRQEFFKRA